MRNKSFLAFLFFFISFLSNIYGQSLEQNYVKTTEYLENILIDSDFLTSYSGWKKSGDVDYLLDNGKLMVNVDNQYEGVKHDLDGFVTRAGEILRIELLFDKGNTQSNIRLYLQEIDDLGNLVNYNVQDNNLQTGLHTFTHVLINSGNKIILKIDKDDTNTNLETYFYIDYINLKIGNNGSVKKSEGIVYLDGFGKEKQIIGVKQSPDLKDVVQHLENDQFDRKIKEYLPFTSTQNTGDYILNAKNQTADFYQNNYSDQHAFSEVRYEDSPLNLRLETSSPGNTWALDPLSDNDHTVKYGYDVNIENEVYLINISTDVNYPLNISYYPKGKLMKNIFKNENWNTNDGFLNTREVFTDLNGRKIAEFVYEEKNGLVNKLTTYYVYDDYGNLRYILSPKVFENIIQGFNNYSASWPINDFLEQGSINATLTLSISNNLLSLSLSKHLTSTIYDKLLYPEKTKVLSTSSPLPNMFIGSVMGYCGLMNSNGTEALVPVGEAYIVDGNLVIGSELLVESRDLSIKLFKSLPNFLIDKNTLDNLAYQFKYDEFNRQIEQKIPGRDWEYMIYDLQDRPFLTQDPNLRSQGKWLFNKYDTFGRVVYSGLYSDISSRETLQLQVDNFLSNSNNKSNSEKRSISLNYSGGVLINYENNAFPNSNIETLSVNYYDDYNFTILSQIVIPVNILGQEVTNRTKGLLTASMTKDLDNNTWSKVYTFYDNKGRVISEVEENHLGGITKNESKLDFRGKIIQSITNHKRLSSSQNLVIEDYFEYDHAERPLKHYQKINNQSQELIAKNDYNELGQVITKKIGGTDSNSLQNVNYTYNVRGWVTQVNDVDNLGTDLFGYKINYDDIIEGSAAVTDIYDGNIKQIIWKSAHNNIKKAYAFEYDKLGRFSKSIYRENASLTDGVGKFETYSTSYDSNGNIASLSRNNQDGLQMDKLSYLYDDGNKLLSIKDLTNNNSGFFDGNTNGNDYVYDVNGNLIRDFNKGIQQIEYNHLDLVESVNFSNGNKIEFDYDANGTKLRMRNIQSSGIITTTEYFGSFQYVDSQLKFFSTSEGYVSADGSNFKYVYIYKDHLGNNRLSFSDSNNDLDISLNEILSSTDYYVMGLTHNGEFVSSIASNYNYKYNSKEQLAFAGYNMYDFGSRMYDPSVGRWFNIDPQNQFLSPYLAMGNNYIIVVDPNGEWIHIAVGAIVGGVINVAVNWDQITSGDGSTWEKIGKGAVYFTTGAVAGGVTAATGNPAAGGAILAAGNSIYGQYLNNGKIDWGQTALDTSIGALTAHIGGQFSSKLTPYTSKLFSNVGGEILQKYLTNAATSTVVGFGLQFGTEFTIGGKTFEGALQSAVNNIPQSLAISAIGTTGELARKYYGNKQVKVEQQTKEVAKSQSSNQLTNEQLVQEAANEAYKATKNLGLSPMEQGKAAHKYAENFIIEYQKINGNRGLQTEVTFKRTINNIEYKGRLDVIDSFNNKIYDYKFGKSGWSSGQFSKYQMSFPAFEVNLMRPIQPPFIYKIQ